MLWEAVKDHMMRALLCVLLTAMLSASPAFAEGPEISWADLPDASTQVFDDPFAALSLEALRALAVVARSQERLSQNALAEDARQDAERRLSKARADLVALGVDADALLAQRWRIAKKREAAAVSANPALDGQEVTLAGFAIAAPPDPDGTNVIYLVSMPGLCSHLPPPPPNQLIRVRLPGDWMPDRLHAPVRLTGRLDIVWSDRMMHVVDGLVPMRSSYAMQAHAVEEAPSMFRELPAE